MPTREFSDKLSPGTATGRPLFQENDCDGTAVSRRYALIFRFDASRDVTRPLGSSLVRYLFDAWCAATVSIAADKVQRERSWG